MDLTAGVSPAGCFRYPPIAVKLIEPGIRIRLQHTTEPCKMDLRVTTVFHRGGVIQGTVCGCGSGAADAALPEGDVSIVTPNRLQR